MKFNNSDLLIYSGSSFNVSLNKNDNIQIEFISSNNILENKDKYSKLILGKCDTCDAW